MPIFANRCFAHGISQDLCDFAHIGFVHDGLVVSVDKIMLDAASRKSSPSERGIIGRNPRLPRTAIVTRGYSIASRLIQGVGSVARTDRCLKDERPGVAFSLERRRTEATR